MKHILKPFLIRSFLGIITLVFFLQTSINPALASFNTLAACKDSPAFQKRLLTATKKLEARKKLYANNSKEYYALVKEIESTTARFKKYENASLLCGKEGLPRIIVSGQWDHASEFMVPGILFLYITGWIGWVGRKYISYANSTENAFEAEIIINIPAALSMMLSGFAWPYDALRELKAKTLFVSDEEITISPR